MNKFLQQLLIERDLILCIMPYQYDFGVNVKHEINKLLQGLFNRDIAFIPHEYDFVINVEPKIPYFNFCYPMFYLELQVV